MATVVPATKYPTVYDLFQQAAEERATIKDLGGDMPLPDLEALVHHARLTEEVALARYQLLPQLHVGTIDPEDGSPCYQVVFCPDADCVTGYQYPLDDEEETIRRHHWVTHHHDGELPA